MSTLSGSGSSPAVSQAAGLGRMIVARGLDGMLLKGTTHDFNPRKPTFHLYTLGDESSRADEVSVESLKALFFVKDFEGQKYHEEKKDAEPPMGQGRKIQVAFVDGEVMNGTTMGYNAKAQGFFMIPADPESNNVRIFVVNKAVREVNWL